MQELDIPRLLKKIHRHNGTILPALVDPEPFNEWKKRADEECDELRGDNAEVLVALEFGARDLLAQTAMGIYYLQSIFGKKPKYVVND